MTGWPKETFQKYYPTTQVAKESACKLGDLGSVPGLGRSPGEGKGYPLQHTGLENSMGSIVHGGAKSQGRLSGFQFHTSYFSAEKISQVVLVEPAHQCRGRKRCGWDPWVGKIRWRRKWHPAPVFLPGRSHGQRSLVGWSPWGHTKSQTRLSTHALLCCVDGDKFRKDSRRNTWSKRWGRCKEEKIFWAKSFIRR